MVISERKHNHVIETGLSLLTHAEISMSHWPYAFAAATYFINRLSTLVLSMESSVQKLFCTTPNYNKLHIFGCLCFPWLRSYNTNKLENRTTQYVFLGYSLTQRTYICLKPSSGRIYVSRHVKFDETVFPTENNLWLKTGSSSMVHRAKDISHPTQFHKLVVRHILVHSSLRVRFCLSPRLCG